MGTFEDNISKYLRFLEKEGWSDLIDERWKVDVRKSLIYHFPDMTTKDRIDKIVLSKYFGSIFRT